MTATLSVDPAVLVRDAVPEDNDALLAIAARCPMEGDISVRLTREPDFFQLDRLEGARWRLGVAEAEGRVVGCVMAAQRHSYLHGAERPTLYAGDLKVDPSMRGKGVADELCEWARQALREMGGTASPVLLTILGGNRAMERRTTGRGGMPWFRRFATIRVFSIPLLFPRGGADATLRVTAATASDVEEMWSLWRRVAPARQFAPLFTADSFAEWIAAAPGLTISDYRVARDSRGRIAGFLAWWDQEQFKQLRVLRYSPRLRVARTILNGAAGLTGGTPLPAAGEPLRYRNAVHVCVPGETPGVLRALLRSTHAELRASRYAFAAIGLDARDPLCAALGGLFAQPTDVNAYVCTTRGGYSPEALADRPLHYEIALV
jgi:ribosomal protein S18 acetylase RimI-like enzyme